MVNMYKSRDPAKIPDVAVHAKRQLDVEHSRQGEIEMKRQLVIHNTAGFDDLSAEDQKQLFRRKGCYPNMSDARQIFLEHFLLGRGRDQVVKGGTASAKTWNAMKQLTAPDMNQKTIMKNCVVTAKREQA